MVSTSSLFLSSLALMVSVNAIPSNSALSEYVNIVKSNFETQPNQCTGTCCNDAYSCCLAIKGRWDYGSVPNSRWDYGSVPESKWDYGSVVERRQEYSSVSKSKWDYGSVPEGRWDYGSVPNSESDYRRCTF